MLTPFHNNSAGNFWTSALVRQTATFGYTYPELIGTNIQALTAKVNQLYGPDASAPSSKRNAGESTDQIDGLGPPMVGIGGAPTFAGQRQYTANIQVRKFGLDGSFDIYIFLGNKPGDDPDKWMTERSFVGVTGIFSSAGVPDQLSDLLEAKSDVNGAVPLTAALEAKVRSGELKSMDACVVAKYLRANLSWKVSRVSIPLSSGTRLRN